MVKQLSDYQISEEAFNLRDLMDRSLAAVVTTYERFNTPLPTRRYWAFGRPAEDCEQVVVSFIQMYLGAPGDQASTPQRCRVALRSAVLEIAITRNFPIGANGKAVPAEHIIAASEFSAVDSWILMESATVFDDWGDGLPSMGVIATVSANDPGGSLQTIVMTITVAIP